MSKQTLSMIRKCKNNTLFLTEHSKLYTLFLKLMIVCMSQGWGLSYFLVNWYENKFGNSFQSATCLWKTHSSKSWWKSHPVLDNLIKIMTLFLTPACKKWDPLLRHTHTMQYIISSPPGLSMTVLELFCPLPHFLVKHNIKFPFFIFALCKQK